MELLNLNNDELLHILSFLNKKDVLAVSDTCTRLQDLCLSTSSLWRSFTVNFGHESKGCLREVTLTDEDTKILKIIDDRLRNMHISVNVNGFVEIDQMSLTLLSTSAKKSNLQEFCFEAFDFPCRGGISTSYSGHPVLMESITRLIENCLTPTTWSSTRLRTLSLSACIDSLDDTWTYMRALLNILRSSKFCGERLESFTLDRYLPVDHELFWNHDDQNEIICAYGDIIGRFKNLQTLEINSLYLSDSLLDALSQPDRVRLQSMTLCVSGFHDREITSWPRLLHSSPALKVMVHAIDLDFSSRAFLRAIPPCVPLISFRMCNLRKQKMLDLISQYQQTLESVELQYFTEMNHQSKVLNMITQCSRLHTVCLYGKIRSTAILKIASLPRNWLKLSVSDEDIIFPRSWIDSYTNNVERLCVEVSGALGREWKPESEKMFRDMFNYFTLIL